MYAGGGADWAQPLTTFHLQMTVLGPGEPLFAAALLPPKKPTTIRMLTFNPALGAP